MIAVHRNHEALQAAAQPREEMVRLELRTVNGLWFIPSASGYLALRYVPANVSGLCNATFFDKQGRETRTNVTIRLPGDSVGKLSSSSKDQPLLAAGHKGAESARAAAEAEAEADDEEEVSDSTDEDSDDGEEEQDSDDTGDDESALNMLRRRESPEVEVLEREEQLYSDLTEARQVQIRTAVSTHEEAMGMQIEAEKLRIIRGHSYTREIGENQQLMTMMRRDIAAMLATMRDVGRSQVVSSEAAGNAMLRMARKVAKQLRDPSFAKPPPP
ncbi:MAG: hypothetical protein JNM40_23130, partial [Myxococcales bacterium]|nr:hypothetical protein [Myxococcales bacterium]